MRELYLVRIDGLGDSITQGIPIPEWRVVRPAQPGMKRCMDEREFIEGIEEKYLELQLTEAQFSVVLQRGMVIGWMGLDS